MIKKCYGLGLLLTAKDLASDPHEDDARREMSVVLCPAWGGLSRNSPFTGGEVPVAPSPPPVEVPAQERVILGRCQNKILASAGEDAGLLLCTRVLGHMGSCHFKQR
jgi:hypothetical protein